MVGLSPVLERRRMEGLIIQRGSDGKTEKSSASSRETGSGDIIYSAGGQPASPTGVAAALVADPVCLKSIHTIHT